MSYDGPPRTPYTPGHSTDNPAYVAGLVGTPGPSRELGRSQQRLDTILSVLGNLHPGEQTVVNEARRALVSIWHDGNRTRDQRANAAAVVLGAVQHQLITPDEALRSIRSVTPAHSGSHHSPPGDLGYTPPPHPAVFFTDSPPFNPATPQFRRSPTASSRSRRSSIIQTVEPGHVHYDQYAPHDMAPAYGTIHATASPDRDIPYGPASPGSSPRASPVRSLSSHSSDARNDEDEAARRRRQRRTSTSGSRSLAKTGSSAAASLMTDRQRRRYGM